MPHLMGKPEKRRTSAGIVCFTRFRDRQTDRQTETEREGERERESNSVDDVCVGCSREQSPDDVTVTVPCRPHDGSHSVLTQTDRQLVMSDYIDNNTQVPTTLHGVVSTTSGPVQSAHISSCMALVVIVISVCELASK